MNMRRTVRILLALPLLAGCASDPKEEAEQWARDSIRAVVDVEIRQAAARQKVEAQAEREREDKEHAVAVAKRCQAVAGLPGSLEKVIAEPRLYAGGDTCARDLMDAIVERFTRTNEKQYLEALDALSLAGDSKSNEALGNAVLDLFRARPIELIRHLYDLQGDPAATEVDALLVTEIQLGRNSSFTEEIQAILDRLETGVELSTDEKRYLARIESQMWATG
jgi:hypothetical protein